MVLDLETRLTTFSPSLQMLWWMSLRTVKGLVPTLANFSVKCSTEVRFASEDGSMHVCQIEKTIDTGTEVSNVLLIRMLSLSARFLFANKIAGSPW